MGSMLVKLVQSTEGFALAGTVTREEALEPLLSAADVVIDFTSAEASVSHAKVCAAAKVPLVVGSTGFNAESRAQMAEAAKSIPVVLAPNMSIGLNVMVEVVAQLARQLGNDFDIDVLEAHHRHKKDAPSGTALRLADELVKATGRAASDVRTSRVGLTGERPRAEIGVQTLRGGDVVGEHTVFFFGEGERLEVSHRASDRTQFGRGALRAAKWVAGHAPGLYDMADVLR